MRQPKPFLKCGFRRTWSTINGSTGVLVPFLTILYILSAFWNTNFTNYWNDYNQKYNAARDVIGRATRYAGFLIGPAGAIEQNPTEQRIAFADFQGAYWGNIDLFGGKKLGNCLNAIRDLVEAAEAGELPPFLTAPGVEKPTSRQITDAVLEAQRVLSEESDAQAPTLLSFVTAQRRLPDVSSRQRCGRR